MGFAAAENSVLRGALVVESKPEYSVVVARAAMALGTRGATTAAAQARMDGYRFVFGREKQPSSLPAMRSRRILSKTDRSFSTPLSAEAEKLPGADSCAILFPLTQVSGFIENRQTPRKPWGR